MKTHLHHTRIKTVSLIDNHKLSERTQLKSAPTNEIIQEKKHLSSTRFDRLKWNFPD